MKRNIHFYLHNYFVHFWIPRNGRMLVSYCRKQMERDISLLWQVSLSFRHLCQLKGKSSYIMVKKVQNIVPYWNVKLSVLCALQKIENLPRDVSFSISFIHIHCYSVV